MKKMLAGIVRKITCTLFICLFFTCHAQPPVFTATVNNAPAGYYFISAYKGAVVSYPIILDGSGNIVYYKKIIGSNSGDFKLNPDGRMSYFMSSKTKFMIFDSTFKPVDSVAAVGYTTNAHELQILPNGHYLILGYEIITQDLSAYNYFNNNGSPGSTSALVKADIVQELDANKNLIFDWHYKDYFPFDEVDPYFLMSPNNVDWSHANAIEWDQDGNILLSSRHFNEITKIDRGTGNIIWHFGGNYNQFTFLTDTTPFYGQHDIRRLPNGHVTLYDDGNHTIWHPARGVEYELDETNMTAKLVWSYTYDSLMYSTAMGGVQMLTNKSAILDYGITNKDSICFNMVDSLSTELYKIKFNTGLYSYRTHYYPNLPWQINRPTVSCFDSLGNYYLKLDSVYSNYLWSNGSTLSSLLITTPGTYFVYVPYGYGGYVSSYPLLITNLSAQCSSTTQLAQQDNYSNYNLFPNPAGNQLTVSGRDLDKNKIPLIRDVYGNSFELHATINQVNNSFTFDISELAAGVYFLNTPYKTFKFIKNNN